jgi:hypothetical protein
MKNVLVVLILTLLLSCNKKEDVSHLGDYEIGNLELGISFPPVEKESDRKKGAKFLDELKVKKIRFGEEWKFREEEEGKFNWSPLDDRLNWANDNNFEVLLTIQSNAPSWACISESNDNSCVFDNVAFKHYIETLVQRYDGKISKIQFGNEWQSDFWYVGNAQEFTAASNIVYEAIQSYSPSTEFVLGGFTAISLRFMAGCEGLVTEFYNDEGEYFDTEYLESNCGSSEIVDVLEKVDYVLNNAKYDLLDLHFYDDVENWKVYFDYFKTLTSKPIIVTEFGGPNLNYEDDSQDSQAERLYKYIEVLNTLDISEAYYFKLIEGSKNDVHDKSGLMKPLFKRKKKNFYVFKKFAN